MRPLPLTVALLFCVVNTTVMKADAQGTGVKPSYPSKPIRAVVPFPPGGTPDIQLRLLAEKLAARLGQQLVVDNRPGAAGNIAMEFVARAPADGYTLVVTTVGTWAVNPHLYKLPYDVLTDFSPVIHIANTPGVLVVHPSLPVRTVREMIALAKARPGELNYGSAGVGGFFHISAELLASMARIRLTHVPYKGAAPALTALMGGHIHLMINTPAVTAPHLKSNRVRGLATTGATRAPLLQELPTLAEAGVPGYENTTWTAVAAPARTPQPIVDRLNQDFNAVLQLADIRERFVAAGSSITGGTPQDFQRILRHEHATLGKLMATAGITAGVN